MISKQQVGTALLSCYYCSCPVIYWALTATGWGFLLLLCLPAFALGLGGVVMLFASASEAKRPLLSVSLAALSAIGLFITPLLAGEFLYGESDSYLNNYDMWLFAIGVVHVVIAFALTRSRVRCADR